MKQSCASVYCMRFDSRDEVDLLISIALSESNGPEIQVRKCFQISRQPNASHLLRLGKC